MVNTFVDKLVFMMGRQGCIHRLGQIRVSTLANRVLPIVVNRDGETDMTSLYGIPCNTISDQD